MLNNLLYGNYGVNVISNELCIATEPMRKHSKTRSMSESYHTRVQKKWIKRFGTKQVPAAYMTPHGLIAHPAIIEKLRQAI